MRIHTLLFSLLIGAVVLSQSAFAVDCAGFPQWNNQTAYQGSDQVQYNSVGYQANWWTQDHNPDWLDRFRRATRSIPEILGVYRMTGDLDYLIRARVADMADYDRLYQQLIARIELSDVSASFVMEEIKDSTELPL